jgi:hypothetical protein
VIGDPDCTINTVLGSNIYNINYNAYNLYHTSKMIKSERFYQSYLDMRNTAVVTGGEPIGIRLQYISGVSAINPLVAFEREVISFYFVLDTRLKRIYININIVRTYN